MPSARLSLAAAACWGLAACSVQGPLLDPPSGFPRLPPQSLGRTLEREQVLRISRGEQRASFQCVVRVTDTALVIVALAPLGPRLFTVTWDGIELSTESRGESGAPPPEQLLADLQMAYWPLPVLEVATAGTAWQVSEPQPGLRQVLRAGEPYAEIRYASAEPWDGQLSLRNAALGYALDIDSRPIAP